MIRVRRYRVFLAFVVFFFAGLYFFNRSPAWETGTNPIKGGFGLPETESQTPQQKADKVVHENARPPSAAEPLHKARPSSSTSASSSSSTSAHSSSSSAQSSTSSAQLASTTTLTDTDETPSVGGKHGGSEFTDLKKVSSTPDRLEEPKLQDLTPKIHWSSQAEHYPVPTTIQLPTGTPVKIPKIQFQFDRETAGQKTDREEKLLAIRKSFLRSWEGYKKYAWLHDELKPVSGGHKDPFCGWAATLVDSLDTLWLMGLKAEFEEAVEAVGTIDFTTATSNEIPVFETTIRYLGGLIAGYDISGRRQQYKVLLDKAVELADVMMGAFDTPNRMPLLHYPWKPAFTSQSHRASSNSIMSEAGSLSMEFTHLARLTGEPKYYDAIARVMNAFAEFQNKSSLPGMWPLKLDMSRCAAVPGKDDESDSALGKPTAGLANALYPDVDEEPSKAPETTVTTAENWESLKDKSTFGTDRNKVKPEPVVNVAEELKIKDKSTFGTDRVSTSDMKAGTTRRSVHDKRQLVSGLEDFCNEPRLSSSTGGMDTYTLSGMADSTYEYLPKQWLMLGGLEDQYRTMYLGAIDAVKDYLLYRPMIKEDRQLLFTGEVDTDGSKDSKGRIGTDLRTEVGHLQCFGGGMFALGAKIFERPDELDIAGKLADGCVWLYESTASGIMPESSFVIPCDSIKDCPWNQTTYYAALDSYFKSHKAPTEAAVSSGPTLSKTKAKPNGPAPINDIPEMQVAKPPEIDRRQLGSLASAGSRQAIADKSDDKSDTAKDSEEAKASSSSSSSASSTSMSSTSTTSTATSSSESSQPTGDEDAKVQPSYPKRPQAPGSKPIDPNGVFKKPLHSADRTKAHKDSGTLIHSTYTDEDTDEEEETVSSTEPEPDSAEAHEQIVLEKIKNQHLHPGVTRVAQSHYILRPEAIESVFYMYRITGNSTWRDKGWKMFEAIEKATRTEHGSSGVRDVTQTLLELDDKMESFWLAETLKYFYLLFSHESVVSLDEYVLNTEAHFFKRPDAADRSKEASLGYPG